MSYYVANGTFYAVPARSNELYHYGVKGMKWGVRKSTSSVNKSYTVKQRKQDRAFYGKGGEKRINKRLNEGHGLRGARHYEAERKERNEKTKKLVKKSAKAAAQAASNIGLMYMTDQIFYGGAGTRACKQAIRGIGMAVITAYTMARGGHDIKWYDKHGRRVG